MIAIFFLAGQIHRGEERKIFLIVTTQKNPADAAEWTAGYQSPGTSTKPF